MAHELSEAGHDIVRALPVWMPKDNESGNRLLLDVIGESIDNFDADLSEIDRETTIQTASKNASISEIGAPFDTVSKSAESVEKYRLRTFTEYQSITSEGTVGGLINRIAGILNVDPETVEYEEKPAEITLTPPPGSIDNIALSPTELSENGRLLIPAGYQLSFRVLGTFTYTSSGEYNLGNSVPDRGYDGLDTNGDPKENGGTYSAILK